MVTVDPHCKDEDYEQNSAVEANKRLHFRSSQLYMKSLLYHFNSHFHCHFRCHYTMNPNADHPRSNMQPRNNGSLQVTDFG